MATKTAFADRTAFITYHSKQTKTWLTNALAKETGDDWQHGFELTARELATQLADLQGWADQPIVSDDLTDGTLEFADETDPEIENVPTERTDDQEPEEDEVVSSDQLPAKAAKPKDPRTVTELLAEYKTTESARAKKQLRALLRARGYRLSDHKEPKPAKEKKAKAEAKK